MVLKKPLVATVDCKRFFLARPKPRPLLRLRPILEVAVSIVYGVVLCCAVPCYTVLYRTGSCFHWLVPVLMIAGVPTLVLFP